MSAQRGTFARCISRSTEGSLSPGTRNRQFKGSHYGAAKEPKNKLSKQGQALDSASVPDGGEERTWGKPAVVFNLGSERGTEPAVVFTAGHSKVPVLAEKSDCLAEMKKKAKIVAIAEKRRRAAIRIQVRC